MKRPLKLQLPNRNNDFSNSIIFELDMFEVNVYMCFCTIHTFVDNPQASHHQPTNRWIFTNGHVAICSSTEFSSKSSCQQELNTPHESNLLCPSRVLPFTYWIQTVSRLAFESRLLLRVR